MHISYQNLELRTRPVWSLSLPLFLAQRRPWFHSIVDILWLCLVILFLRMLFHFLQRENSLILMKAIFFCVVKIVIYILLASFEGEGRLHIVKQDCIVNEIQANIFQSAIEISFRYYHGKLHNILYIKK